MISNNLHCDGCSAVRLRDINASWKRHCENLRQEEINSVSKIRLFHTLFFNSSNQFITIFPSKCGFLKRRLPDIQKRVKYEFQFTDLRGLKDAIHGLVRDNKNISGKEVLEACFQGDKRAITTFYEKYKDLIYSAIHKWINKYAAATDREEDVKEVFNEAIISIMHDNFAKLKNAWDLNNVSGLVFLIAYQTTGRYFEKKWKDRKRRSEDTISDLPGEGNNPIDKLIAQEKIRLVDEFLTALGPLEQKVIELRYGDGFKYRKIATRLELSTVHVGVIINRVKEKLAAFVRERYDKT